MTHDEMVRMREPMKVQTPPPDLNLISKMRRQPVSKISS